MYSSANYMDHVVHLILNTYLSYNWEVQTLTYVSAGGVFDSLHPIPPPPPLLLVTTILISFSMGEVVCFGSIIDP